MFFVWLAILTLWIQRCDLVIQAVLHAEEEGNGVDLSREVCVCVSRTLQSHRIGSSSLPYS